MNPLIVALDTDDLERLRTLAETLAPHAGLVKVGLQAYVAHGADAVKSVAAYAPVFADLKLHDIPNTVAGAAAAAARLGVAMLTVHASGGPAMVAAAVQAAPGVQILGVTVLTSLDEPALAAVGQGLRRGLGPPDPQDPLAEQGTRLADLALAAGAAGVVCAPGEVAAIRAAIGDEPLIVVPGVRPSPHGRDLAWRGAREVQAWRGAGEVQAGGAGRDDQARVGTPRAAMDAGASYIVVGRPITAASDPVAAARAIGAELRSGAPAAP